MKEVKAGLEGVTHQSAQNLKVIGSLAGLFVTSEGSGEADIVARIIDGLRRIDSYFFSCS